MDSLSQIALGAAVGVATMGGRTAIWKAALWGAVAGTLPDLDVFIVPVTQGLDQDRDHLRIRGLNVREGHRR